MGEENLARDTPSHELKPPYAAAKTADATERAGSMRGPDRATLYPYAMATGLRQSERASARVRRPPRPATGLCW